MPISISMSEAQYEQLAGLARQGVNTAEGQRMLGDFLVGIEEANGITRYFLWVRWQEVGRIHPANQPFPENWPPTQEAKIERLNFPVSRATVEAVVADRSKNPTNILVSEDPGGELGWTSIDQYFS